MRRYILSMAMAVFAFVTLLPLKAVSAEESKEKKESGADKAWINCVSEDGAASVNLHFPGATEKRISRIRIDSRLRLPQTTTHFYADARFSFSPDVSGVSGLSSILWTSRNIVDATNAHTTVTIPTRILSARSQSSR